MVFEDTFPVAYNYEQQRRFQQARDVFSPKPDQPNPSKFGKIIKYEQVFTRSGQSSIYVFVRFDDELSTITQASTKRGFILGHPSEEIAVLYGDDLAGLRCKVDFWGSNPDQGIVTIVNTTGLGDLEAANKLPDFGTILAPAG